MFKLVLEKAKEPEIKLPISTGKRILEKSSTSASLTMPKPLTVWTTTNCGKILKEMGIPDQGIPDLPLEKFVCRSGSNS